MLKEQTDSTRLEQLIREQIQKLAEISQSIGETTQLDVNIEKIFDIILSFNDYCAVWIYLRHPDSGEICLHSYKGLSPQAVEFEKHQDFSDCLVDYVFKTGQVIALKDIEQCRRKALLESIAEHSIRTHLSLPIKDEGKTIGVLNAGTRTKRKYRSQEIQFFVIVANMIGMLLKVSKSQRLIEDSKGQQQDISIQNLIGKIVDGILIMEKDFKVTLINPAGRPFMDGLSEFEKGEFFEKLSEVERIILGNLSAAGRDLFEQEIQLSPPAGKVLRLTATALKSASEEIESILILVKDVTDEKTMARKERIQAKVSSISSLLDGITHELNNPLAAVSGYLQMLQMKYSADDQIADLTGKMERELNRAIIIVRNLVALAEKKPIEKVPVQLGKLMEKVITEYEFLHKEMAIGIHLTVDPAVPVLYAELDNMKQVFRNIIDTNTQKAGASTGAGSLNVIIQNKQDTVQIIFENAGTDLFVRNTAEKSTSELIGDLPEQDMEISLAFCSMVVKNHGGVIYSETGQGRGSGFVIELPIFPEELA